ncbi:sugar ABC transporter permease [Actinoplanes sp. SE50]|uniref:carbohydrate ABC transporter permease n=1 Tax=unclassified Actinoplanes TaxID=2626549 RepID=UPI00023ED598|nr:MULTISPECIES: sugar ABC transporter permease [unclassified Actinoplanes]AEV82838.1 Maltose transport system permease protein malF [Actinoplanes sp. SE50/110]ATO81234.1 sugar ABC transporter permease [Actinoplanes sp. SE50]SLL98641.1 sugar ABC transporter permease [Actinoplanes sp. SE50/110]
MYAVDSPATRTPTGPAGSGAKRPVGRRRARRGSEEGSGLPWLLSTPALLLLAALLAYPFGRMLVISFQKFGVKQLWTGAAAPWSGIDNYIDTLSDSAFWSVVGHTVLFTAVSVVLSVLSGLGVALLMRRVGRTVRLLMIIAMMFVWALPALVQAQIFKMMTDSDVGVLNYLIDKLPGVSFENHSWFYTPTQGWIVITACVLWAGIPFLAITLNAGLTQVPKELMEAATVDGANAWQSFRNITLPILKPLLVIVTTLSVIWNFGLFTQSWVLRDGKPEPEFHSLATYLYAQAFAQNKYGLGSAIAVLTILLLLGAMTVYIRQMFKIGEVD